MKYNNFFRFARDKIFQSSFVLSLILSASGLNAQNPSDFSGKWIFDIKKSDPGKGSTFTQSDMTHVISQNPSSISIEEFIDQKSTGIKKFRLDGKETTEEEGSRIIKKSAVWSQDKKTLILTEITTISGQDYRTDDTYGLSANGLVLTVKSVTRGPNFEILTILVYNKNDH